MLKISRQPAMDILDLPPTVTLHIFSYLSPTDLVGGVRRACKAWNELSYERCLWKHVHLYKDGLHNKLSSSSFINFLRDIRGSVKSLDFERTNFSSECYLHEDVHCPCLTKINLFGSEISIDCVPLMLEKYKHIETLSLSLKIKSSTRFLATVQRLSQMQKLKNLTIHNCCIDEGDEPAKLCMYRLLNTHKNLESLSFVHCRFPNDLYRQAIENNPNLQNFSLDKRGELHTEIFRTRTGFKQLMNLNIAGRMCQDDILLSVADTATQLESVSVDSYRSFITDFGISYLAEHCIHLRKIIISRTRFENCNLTSTGLEAIARNCRSLRNLAVSYCFAINDVGVSAIAESCKGLEMLEIAGCFEVSDLGVVCLVENCPRLRKLNLSECDQITNLSVNTIITRLKHLKHLNVEKCKLVCSLNFKALDSRNGDILLGTPETLSVMGNIDKHSFDGQRIELKGRTSSLNEHGVVISTIEENKINTVLQEATTDTQTEAYNTLGDQKISLEETHSHIFELFLGYCSAISVQSLQQISSFCPDIRELTLQECENLTDSSIELLVRSCKSLAKLDISGGLNTHPTKLTDQCLCSIAKWCKCLKDLVILHNLNIRVHGISELVVRCPSIELVSVSFGDITRITMSGLNTVLGKIETKLVKPKKMGPTMADIFVYLNRSMPKQR